MSACSQIALLLFHRLLITINGHQWFVLLAATTATVTTAAVVTAAA
jgi:hypothetical protein